MKICKLCRKPKTLIKTSHIISDFLHDELYDEKHRLIKFHPNELKKDAPKISTPPSATYEGGILCAKCDNDIIGKYESYASKLLRNLLPKNKKPTCKEVFDQTLEKTFEVENLDYQKLKLFLLSILWRSSISSRPEFQNIDLKENEERVRNQIYNGTASNENDIQIAIFKFEKEAQFSTFIAPPLLNNGEDKPYYSTIILGYVIIFHFQESEESKFWKQYSLKENGKLLLYELPKDKVGKFVMGYTGVVKDIKL